MKTPVIIFFVALCLFLLALASLSSGTFVTSSLAIVTRPIQQLVFRSFPSDPKYKKLEQENRQLTKQLVELETLKQDNAALRDQFQAGKIKSNMLLPSSVIAAPAFIPGVTLPEELIIGSGSDDGVKIGQAVIVKDYLVGRIIRVSRRVSAITLISNRAFSLGVKTVQTNAPGIIKGKGEQELTLGNALLSDELKVSDIVVTLGTIDQQGVGIPPGIIVGTITSVDKKPSALFQKANVKSSLSFSKLSTVFVITQYR